jgi:hypothetical protein
MHPRPVYTAAYKRLIVEGLILAKEIRGETNLTDFRLVGEMVACLWDLSSPASSDGAWCVNSRPGMGLPQF